MTRFLMVSLSAPSALTATNPPSPARRTASTTTRGVDDGHDLSATARPDLPRLWRHAATRAPRLLLRGAWPRGQRHAARPRLCRLVLSWPLLGRDGRALPAVRQATPPRR